MIFFVTLTSPPGQPTGHPNSDLNILLLVEVGQVLLHRATAQLLGLGRRDYSGRAERRLSFLMMVMVMMKIMDMTLRRTGMMKTTCAIVRLPDACLLSFGWAEQCEGQQI